MIPVSHHLTPTPHTHPPLLFADGAGGAPGMDATHDDSEEAAGPGPKIEEVD